MTQVFLGVEIAEWLPCGCVVREAASGSWAVNQDWLENSTHEQGQKELDFHLEVALLVTAFLKGFSSPGSSEPQWFTTVCDQQETFALIQCLRLKAPFLVLGPQGSC